MPPRVIPSIQETGLLSDSENISLYYLRTKTNMNSAAHSATRVRTDKIIRRLKLSPPLYLGFEFSTKQNTHSTL